MTHESEVERHASTSFAPLGEGERSASRLGRFNPGKELTVSIWQEAGWAPELLWPRWRKNNPFIAPVGNWTPVVQAASELSRIKKELFPNYVLRFPDFITTLLPKTSRTLVKIPRWVEFQGNFLATMKIKKTSYKEWNTDYTTDRRIIITANHLTYICPNCSVLSCGEPILHPTRTVTPSVIIVAMPQLENNCYTAREESRKCRVVAQVVGWPFLISDDRIQSQRR